MQTVSWNCRGLGNPKKSKAVKDLFRMEPSDILLLQETNIEEEYCLSLSRSKWKKNASMVVSAWGTSRGLATLWSKDKFLLKALFATQHWIYIELQHITSKISIALFNLYVPVNFTKKKVCWNSLSYFIEIHSPINIIVVGDLNIILDPDEKSAGV